MSRGYKGVGKPECNPRRQMPISDEKYDRVWESAYKSGRTFRFVFLLNPYRTSDGNDGRRREEITRTRALDVKAAKHKFAQFIRRLKKQGNPLFYRIRAARRHGFLIGVKQI